MFQECALARSLRMPQATAQGREAFKSHIEALEKFLKSK